MIKILKRSGVKSMLKEFDKTMEKIVFYGKWLYVVNEMRHYEDFTLKQFDGMLRDIEFELETTILDEENEAYFETQRFLELAVLKVSDLIEAITQLQSCSSDSEEYHTLYYYMANIYIDLLYKDQKRSEESLQLIDLKWMVNDKLSVYDINLDGIVLEAPDEVEIVQVWLEDAFLQLSKERQQVYYMEMADRIKHVNIVHSCEKYNLDLFKAVNIINKFKQSIGSWLDQLEKGNADYALKADEFSKAFLSIFLNYPEYLRISELNFMIKWMIKFLVEERKKLQHGFIYLPHPLVQKRG